MKDMIKAKKLLLSGGYTCVLCQDENIYTSTLRGVKPLVVWFESEKNFKNYTAADKVVGKATAFLYVLLGVRAVYARVISKSALQVLSENNIRAQYGELAENIINRQADGICPFESAVIDVCDVDVAYSVIREKMREMHISI